MIDAPWVLCELRNSAQNCRQAQMRVALALAFVADRRVDVLAFGVEGGLVDRCVAIGGAAKRLVRCWVNGNIQEVSDLTM